MHKSLLKLVFNTILCASLMLGAATFTACQDYDDDIKNLEGKVTALETAVNDLKTQINNGKWITNVANNADGYTVSLSDGTTLNIVNGTKGSTVEVNKTTNTWWVDGVDTKIPFPYEAAEVNMPKVENGELQLWNAEKKAYEGTGIKANGTYVVDMDSHYVLHVAELKDGKYTEQTINLPKTGSVSDLRVFNYADGVISYGDTKAFSVAYGKDALEKDVEFNGKKYTKGSYLATADGTMLLQVNPVGVEFDKYTVALVNSKGESPLVGLSKPYKHLTKNPYATKANTPNAGFYAVDFIVPKSLDLSDFETIDKINETVTVNCNDKAAYFVKATDPATGNETLAEKFVTLTYAEGTSASIAFEQANFDINEENVLDGTLEVTIVGDKKTLADAKYVDYYFSMIEKQTANFKENGVVFNKETQTISAEKPCTVTLQFNYLGLDGKPVEGDDSKVTLTIKFTSEVEATIDNYEWTLTVNDDDKENGFENQVVNEIPKALYNYLVSDLSAMSKPEETLNVPEDKDMLKAYMLDSKTVKLYYSEDIIVNDKVKVDAKGGNKKAEATDEYSDITFYVFSLEDAKGNVSYHMTAVFANPTTAKYYTTTYNASLTTDESGVETTYEFDVTIKPADFSKLLVREDVYFDGNAATTYGATPTAEAGHVTDKLQKLYKNATDNIWKNVVIEELPFKYIDNKGKEQTAEELWLQENKTIAVPKYVQPTTETPNPIQLGVYTTRNFEVYYKPFGSDQFDLVKVDAFSLTMKSAWYEGTFTLADKVVKEVKEIEDITLSAAEIVLKDKFTDAIETELTVKLSKDAENLMKIYDSEPTDFATKYTKLTFATSLTMPAPTGSTAKPDAVLLGLQDSVKERQSDVVCIVNVILEDNWGMVKTLEVPVTLKKNSTTPAAE